MSGDRPVSVSRAVAALALVPAGDAVEPPLYLDLPSLQSDVVRVMERGSPFCVAVPSSGKPLPSVKVSRGLAWDLPLYFFWLNGESPRCAS